GGRGVLTEMLRQQVDDAREQGEPVAILFATEGGIYGRFGFGVATLQADLHVARGRSAFRERVDMSSLRLVESRQVAGRLQRIAAGAAAAQPGSAARSSTWWRWAVESPSGGGAVET